MSAHDQTIAALLPLAELVAIADAARRNAPRYPEVWAFRVPRLRPHEMKPYSPSDSAEPFLCFEGTMEHHPVEERSCPGGVRHIHHYYRFNGCLL